MQVDGISVEAAEAMQAATIVSGFIAPSTGHLILVTQGGTEIDAGAVVPLASIDLAYNDVTGTKDQFNAALSDGAFVTLAGVETLTNKTLMSPVILGVGQEQIVWKTADESVVSSIVLQNDDHLLFNVVAGEKYIIEGALFKDSPAVDIDLALSGPTLTSLKFGTGDHEFVTAYGDYQRLASAGVGVASVHGYIECSVSGVVYLTWAQNVSNVGPAVLKLGSFLRVRRVA